MNQSSPVAIILLKGIAIFGIQKILVLFTPYNMNLILIILLSICNLYDVSSVVRRKPKNPHNRISGGHDAKIEKRPYQAQCNIEKSSDCGATIINKNTVLVPAHCIDKKYLGYVTINVGSAELYKGEAYNVSKVFIHPYYQVYPAGDARVWRFDIAVLKLDTDIKFNRRTKSIKLQPKDHPIPAGTKAILTGWNRMNKTSSIPNTLQEVKTKIISNEKCSKRYIKIGFEMTDDLLCAFTAKRGVCFEDDGGPLVVGDHLIGIASFFKTCDDRFYPVIYANISYLHDFIVEHM